MTHVTPRCGICGAPGANYCAKCVASERVLCPGCNHHHKEHGPTGCYICSCKGFLLAVDMPFSQAPEGGSLVFTARAMLARLRAHRDELEYLQARLSEHSTEVALESPEDARLLILSMMHLSTVTAECFIALQRNMERSLVRRVFP